MSQLPAQIVVIGSFAFWTCFMTFEKKVIRMRIKKKRILVPKSQSGKVSAERPPLKPIEASRAVSMPTMPPMPPIKELRGQIKARSDTQSLLASTYHLHCEHRKTLYDKPELGRAYSLIAGAAFSLWRAAFLTHTTGESIPSLDDCAKFLGTVARDNIIGFAQDRDSREWTVGYYLNNAVVRLAALTYIRGFEGKQVLEVYREHAKALTSWDTHAAMTKLCIHATERALELLQEAVESPQGGTN